MDNYENFEQLKRQIMMIFEGKDGIPTEVKQIIQEMFNGLETKYREMGCYTPAIQEYMQGNLAELRARLKHEEYQSDNTQLREEILQALEENTQLIE